MALSGPYREHMSVMSRLTEVNWLFVMLILAVAAIGIAVLYSAGGGSFDPWASRQISRFALAIVIMFAAALVDLRFWLRYAYVVYAIGILMLVAVEITGFEAKGAERWLYIGFMRVQPSEVMKIALVLALARYFHKTAAEDVRRLSRLIPALMIIAVPAVLVLKQPDLGTAGMLLLSGAGMLFIAGVRMRWFVLVGAAGLGVLPVLWHHLRDYQKARVLTFLDPERDPLGAGYHILQSKIALGSGGIWGKGFLQGSQSHLSFIPEKQTDFIFSIFAEEFGMVGAIVLLTLYGLILVYGFAIAMRSRNQFGRLLALGITLTFFLYVFINMAMVMGLIPVVGVPLPLISYGGTAMLTLMFGFGLLISVYIHRDARIGRFQGDD
ncbi:MAG: rod shape-determining protein RodA [Candidatus Eiseniibacteriota bacterium]